MFILIYEFSGAGVEFSGTGAGVDVDAISKFSLFQELLVVARCTNSMSTPPAHLAWLCPIFGNDKAIF